MAHTWSDIVGKPTPEFLAKQANAEWDGTEGQALPFTLTYREQGVTTHVGTYATQEEAMSQIPLAGFAPDSWVLADGVLTNLGEEGEYTLSGPVLAPTPVGTEGVRDAYQVFALDGSHIWGYPTLEDAIDATLNAYWDEEYEKGFTIRHGVMTVASLITTELFAPNDGLVAVTRLEGNPSLTMYAVSYELDADDEHYVGTIIRRTTA